jgi:hypothetical protein
MARAFVGERTDNGRCKDNSRSFDCVVRKCANDFAQDDNLGVLAITIREVLTMTIQGLTMTIREGAHHDDSGVLRVMIRKVLRMTLWERK